MSESPWVSVWREWVAAGRPTDIPADELALLRLVEQAEADGWRDRERATHAAEIDRVAEARSLVSRLRRLGCTLTLGRTGQPSVRGPSEHVQPHLEELRFLRAEVMALLLR